MSCPRGLIKLTAVANTIEAWRDWDKLKQDALDMGISQQDIFRIAPKTGDGWRKVDRAISKLRKIMEE